MARDRYFSIQADIHVVNDADVTAESKAKDRLWKVRPIIDKFRETVLSETCPPGTNLYFDRYFTGLALLEALKANGIYGTGTTMKSRFPNIDFKTDGELINEGRGSCDTKIRDDENVLALKWVDNKVITIASTRHGPEPFTPAIRYSRADRQYIEVQMPHIVKEYNANMGGVDLHNDLPSAPRCRKPNCSGRSRVKCFCAF